MGCYGSTNPSRKVHGFRRHTYRPTFWWPTEPSPDWQNAIRAKLSNIGFDASGVIAEMDETVGMARQLGGLLVKLTSKKGRKAIIKELAKEIRMTRKAPAHVLRRASDAELTMRFGVRPLVDDLSSAVANLNVAMHRPLRRIVRSSVEEESTKTVIASVTGYRGSSVVTTRVKKYVTVHVEIDPWRSQFDPGNPLEWGWERIPLSFVVDWFLPIGAWLQQLDALRGITLKAGCVSTLTETTGVSDYQNNTQQYGFTMWQTEKPGLLYYRSHRRDTFTSIPLPRLAWAPEIKKPLEKLQVLCELLIQRRVK